MTTILPRMNLTTNIALSNVDKECTNKIGPNTLLADSGASYCLTNSNEGLIPVEIISSPVKIGNGKALTANKIGKNMILSKRMTKQSM
jgi:hypothetical protein